MGQTLLPGTNSDELADLKRRVGILEATSSLASSSIKDGALTIYDAAGHVLMVVGKQGETGEYGIKVLAAGGTAQLLRATNQGLLSPELAGTSRDPAASKAVTSGTFATQFQVVFGQIVSPAVEIYVPWVTDAATTGELQLTTNAGGTSDVFPLAAGSSGGNYVRWLHGATLLQGPLFVSLQARRTGGAGNVTIFPTVGWSRDPADASSGGSFV